MGEAVNADELYRFCGAHIEVSPACLWWQNGGDGLARLEAAPHIEAVRLVLNGRSLEGTIYAATYLPIWHESTEGKPARLKEIAISMRDAGWNGPRVKVAINECGQIIITDGLHRSSIAFNLHVSIPCEIVYRHERWLKLKYALLELNGGVKLYQPIDHPDLQWPSWRKDTQARVHVISEWIRQHVSPTNSGIDVACNAGVLTNSVARETGMEMIGLDTDLRAVRAATILSEMDGIGCGRVRFSQCQAMPFIPKSDVVICLSLLNHHWTDGREEEGKCLFRELVSAAPTVFIDCPVSGDPVGGASQFNDPAHVLAWCMATGVAGSGQIIAGPPELMRPMLVWTR